MPFLDRELVNADGLGPRHPGAPELLSPRLLLQALDGLPVRLELLRHLLARRFPAASPPIPGKPLRVQRVGREPRKLLLLHLAAPATPTPADLQLPIDAPRPARQIANSPDLPIVETPVRGATLAARCVFCRRTS